MRCAIILLAVAYGALAGPVEDGALQEFAAGNRKFAGSVYKELLKTERGNFIFSPLSAEVVLALTNEGAKGATSKELVSGLSLPSTKEKTQRAIKSFLPQLKRSENNLKLLSANKIYVANDVRLEDSFKSVATNIYESGVENINFANNIKTANTINSWVEENTNQKIRNLIDPDELDPDTAIILVNALYFSGKWVVEFDDFETRKKKFFKTKKDAVEVDTMHQIEYLNYYENPTLNAKFLELPYRSDSRGSNLSMVIVLPNELDGLSSLEQNIEELLQPQPFVQATIDVDLPRFRTETSIKFKPILKELGIKSLFSSGLSNLTGLSSTHKNLYVSHVIQKAFINVTETGTEAAATTGIGVTLLSVPIVPRIYANFHADHPFLYYIRDNLSGVTLFIGRYSR